MDGFTLWLLFVAIPGLDDVFKAFVFLGSLGLAICLFAVPFINDFLPEEERALPIKYVVKAFKVLLSLFFVSVLLGNMVPSREEMLIIVGIDQVSAIDGVEQLPSNLVDYINKQLVGEE